MTESYFKIILSITSDKAERNREPEVQETNWELEGGPGPREILD